MRIVEGSLRPNCTHCYSIVSGIIMKMLLLIFAAIATSAIAQTTPAAIRADFDEKSAPITKKLNDTLMKQGTAIAAELVSKGDTDGAAAVSDQLAKKTTTGFVGQPHASLVTLLTQYDLAWQKALKPIQAASIAKIEVALKTSAGRDLATITELGKLRAEIEEGKLLPVADPKMPRTWSYHVNPDAKETAWLRLLPEGVLEWHDSLAIKSGTWKPKQNGVLIEFEKEHWDVTMTGKTATIEGRSVGTRYLKVKDDP